jgi:hypothetical protein
MNVHHVARADVRLQTIDDASMPEYIHLVYVGRYEAVLSFKGYCYGLYPASCLYINLADRCRP